MHSSSSTYCGCHQSASSTVSTQTERQREQGQRERGRYAAVAWMCMSHGADRCMCVFCFVCVCLSPPSPSSVIRLIIWAFVGVPSLRQIYSYMSDPHCKRIGHQTFLGLLILSTELIVIFKFGRGEFTNPMPDNIRFGFIIYLVGYALTLLFLALRVTRNEAKAQTGVKKDE